MNQTDILGHFNEARSDAKSQALKLQNTLSEFKEKLGDYNTWTTQQIKTFSEIVASSISVTGVQARVQENALYNRFKDVVINFEDLTTFTETNSPEALSTLIQEKIVLLKPLLQAIVGDATKSDKTIDLIKDMVELGVVPPTDSAGNKLVFADELELRKHQLQQIKPKMSELIALFSGDSNVNSVAQGNTAQSPDLLDTILNKADNFTALVSEHSSDTYTNGTLFVAGTKFTITTTDNLIDHNPTVSYDLGAGDPVITLKDNTLTIQLGAADNPTTVEKLKEELWKQAAINADIDETVIDHKLIPAKPKESISAYTDWVSSKAGALNNELDSLGVGAKLNLPPELKTLWDWIREKLEALGIDDLTPEAIVNSLADKLKEKFPNQEAFIDIAKDFLLAFLKEESSLKATFVDELAEQLIVRYPDHETDIDFWQNLIKDLLAINRWDNMWDQLITITEKDYFKNRTLLIAGLNLFDLIRNALQLIKFLEENRISIALKDYPDVEAEEEPVPVSESNSQSSVQDGADTTEPLPLESAGSAQASSTQINFNFSNFSKTLFRKYMGEVLPHLPQELQPLATHLKDGTLEQHIEDLFSIDPLIAQWETEKDTFLTIFRDQNQNYLSPSLGNMADGLIVLFIALLDNLRKQLLGDDAANNTKGAIPQLADLPFQFLQLCIELINDHTSLPDWLEDFLMGDESDEKNEINPVFLLLTMPYTTVKKLFEVTKIAFQKEQAA